MPNEATEANELHEMLNPVCFVLLLNYVLWRPNLHRTVVVQFTHSSLSDLSITLQRFALLLQFFWSLTFCLFICTIIVFVLISFFAQNCSWIELTNFFRNREEQGAEIKLILKIKMNRSIWMCFVIKFACKFRTTNTSSRWPGVCRWCCASTSIVSLLYPSMEFPRC